MASSADIARYLERYGWKRSVAGESNFLAAVEAIRLADETGKGLLVTGEYGRGKTALADIVARAFGVSFTVRLGLTNEWKRLDADWQAYMCEKPYEQSVYLDDLGSEPRINNYGERIEYAADFIVNWHMRHKPRRRLVVTTNLNTEQFDGRYGGRVLSRLKDLCVFLILDGEDHRVCHWVDARKIAR